MSCRIDLTDLITAEAQRQGVDPSIALAVARQESGICHWTPSGSVVTSSAGAIGVMQLEPATAAQLGVDPYDLTQNIAGGITYLKQLYQKYGTWTEALAAYNFGPGNVDAGKSWPSETLNYIKAILGISTVYKAAQPGISAASIAGSVQPASSKVPIAAIILIGGVAVAAFWLAD